MNPYENNPDLANTGWHQPHGHQSIDYYTPTPKRNPMNTLANTLLILAGAALLAAIWLISWQFLATGILLGITGAAIKGNQNKPRETGSYVPINAHRANLPKADDR